MNIKHASLILTLLLTGSVIANESPQVEQTIPPVSDEIQISLQDKISQAIAKFKQTRREDWSYQISRYEDEEGEITSSLELFDPSASLENRWTLIELGGRAATEKEKIAFSRDKLKEASKGKKKSASLMLEKLIQLETLQLISENADELIAEFDVYLEQLGEDASQRLRGELRFNKKRQFIESVEVTNIAPFSPVFAANVTSFVLTLKFTNIKAAILPTERSMNFKGTYAFFSEMEEVSTDSFSNYRYVGSETDE